MTQLGRRLRHSTCDRRAYERAERGSWGRPGTVTADFPHRFQANHLNPWCIGRQPVDLVVANRHRPK
nr:hypothetical protein Itr_chr03CG18970 [Ipomoea trifida]